MNDMAQTIVPKSDQLNADDLIAGPMTIKITGVSIKGGTEQPIAISFEGDNGKPYKACKSMCRVMVTAWGADSKAYTGRSMTLYREPTVKWGGMEVGGIRISHMSNIESALTLALTMTRANKKPFTVRPIAKPKDSAAPPESRTVDAPTGSTDKPAETADFINPDMVVDIADRLKESDIDMARFLKAAKVTSIALLPASAYQKSCAWIEAAKAKTEA